MSMSDDSLTYPPRDHTPQIVYPPEREIKVASDAADLLTLALSAGLGVISAYALSQVFFDSANRWFWAALCVTGLVTGIVKIVQTYRRSVTWITIGRNELCVQRKDKILERVALSDISSYFFPGSGTNPWVELMLRDGREITIGHSDLKSRRADMQLRFVRQIGPLVPKDVIHSRMIAPSDPVGKRMFEHFNAPPSVAMRPGVLYRYSDPEELKKYIELRADALQIISLFIFLLLAIHYVTHWQVYIIAPILTSSGILRKLLWFLPGARFQASLHDRFELVPEGLKVYRGTHSWIVTNPRAADDYLNRVVVAGAPIIRYGKGIRTYFFDPRFIEPAGNTRVYQTVAPPTWRRRKP